MLLSGTLLRTTAVCEPGRTGDATVCRLPVLDPRGRWHRQPAGGDGLRWGLGDGDLEAVDAPPGALVAVSSALNRELKASAKAFLKVCG